MIEAYTQPICHEKKSITRDVDKYNWCNVSSVHILIMENCRFSAHKLLIHLFLIQYFNSQKTIYFKINSIAQGTHIRNKPRFKLDCQNFDAWQCYKNIFSTLRCMRCIYPMTFINCGWWIRPQYHLSLI